MQFLRAAGLAFLSLLAAPALAHQPQAAPAPTAAAQPSGDGDWLYRGSDIPRDPAWHFGTLPNGLRYAVRRNALPAGQVSIRIRIDAGSMHEADTERGWAHFLEHMLFRGTQNYPDRRAREIWQQLGASFGSDSNARTDATNTVYVLNLPHAAREPLDTSLAVLAEMMSQARIEQAAVDAERPVVLAEKGRRPELSVRINEIGQRLFYAGLLYAARDPIGTDETLNGASAEGLRAFYRRWYRPERTTVVMVGDADPAMMEELIRARFGGWRAEGPASAEPDYGRVAEVAQPVAGLAYPGSPTAVNLMWLRQNETLPHTRAREALFLAEALAQQIINRRLEAHARGTSAFVGGAVDTSRSRNIADTTSMSLFARDGNWRGALTEAYAIIGDALRAPPSEAEIQRELSNIRTAVDGTVQAESTIQSQVRAEQMVNAVDNASVVATAAAIREGFEANARLMTPARVGEAMQAMFTGSGPRMLLVTAAPIEGGDAALAEGLAAARAVAPAQRTAEQAVTFADLPRLGSPGRIVSRQRIEDMDVTIVRFANGSTLTFKRTEYERGSVSVQLRFGGGISAMAPDRPSLGWLSGLVAPSGLANLDLSGMERLLTGRRIGLSFGIDENAFVLAGGTNATDLADQLRFLATKLVRPRWDGSLLQRFRAAAVESFDLHTSSASARAGRELGGVIRPNDQRWRPIEKNEMQAVTVEQFRDFYTPYLATGPVNAIIVGDVELEAAIEAARRTIGALPRRPAPTIPAGSTALNAPAPAPEPRRFTHQGDPNQAYALIGWSTVGGIENIRARRALALAANIFETRLFDRLREQEGATYAPDAAHLAADAFPNWGVFYARAEIRPGSVDTFFRIAREIVADLAANPVQADEFARALNPVVSGIERRVATNGYWLDALEDWDHDPRAIQNVRNYLADYRALTPEDVRRAVASYVTDQGDWSMLVLPARSQPASGGTAP
ncbi:MAG TPA: insulinase family protein [Allosphingosinicella sp.]|nr:insulinase family protein [Allosphingosinicella sp.]